MSRLTRSKIYKQKLKKEKKMVVDSTEGYAAGKQNYIHNCVKRRNQQIEK